MNSAFWRGRRVVLTGHTGFKGSWLLLLLETLGADVTGLSLKPEEDTLFRQINGAARCKHHIADIRDFAAVKSVVGAAQPDIILHLAAQPLVRQSYLDPLETYGTNVLGTANVLQAARGLDNLLAIVSVTTDKCYANDGRSTGYVEDDRLGGHDPYSNSKACAELVSQSFRDSFFAERQIGLATARAGNVIGGGDYAADRLIPDAVKALSAGQPIELRNPNAVRPWQHVLEPVSGYCLLAERLASDPKRFAKGWNFGPPAEDVASVSRVVGQLARCWGSDETVAPQLGNHPHEAELLTLDSTRARCELGWKPRLDFEQAIAWTANWYHARLGGSDAAKLCFDQIGAYQSLSSEQTAAA
ncbi:CDP-glucose 4,6-dehydratase [Sphingomonas piscis]|uniref:CDP-glucose 4,6-dehydratase n=1 Tax=Sphingomonas piscis TaxID=2714943 RepID=UPI0019CFEED6|nr:CDP-glucose 4,6-dehydratase [Sphingomonas piscis]